jgi:heptosyltransferase-2
MATPMLRTLREHFGPETRLVGITRPYLADVLKGTGWLDEQWLFNPRAQQGESRDWTLVRRMHQERFDTVLLLPNSFRANVLAWLGGARRRVGYVRHGRGGLLTNKLDWPHRNGRVSDYSMVDHYLKLAEAIGCPPGATHLELATQETDEQTADGVWNNLGLRADGRVVLLNSGGARDAAKSWPVKHSGDLARWLAGEMDCDVLVMCGPNQRQTAQEIVLRADHPRVFSMADQPLDLGTAKACIRRGRLMISNDSGIRFIAAAFGKPVITLLGPMLPTWSDLPGMRSVNLYLDLDCIGCQNRVCPLRHHKCMQDLSVDMVCGEVAKLLEGSLAACAAA